MNEKKMILVRVTFEKPIEGERLLAEDGVCPLNRMTSDNSPCIYTSFIERIIHTVLIFGQCTEQKCARQAINDAEVVIFPSPRTPVSRVMPILGITSIDLIKQTISVRKDPLDPFCKEYEDRTFKVETTNPGTYVDLEIEYIPDRLNVERLLNHETLVYQNQSFVVEVLKDVTEITKIDKEIRKLKSQIFELERRKSLLQQ